MLIMVQDLKLKYGLIKIVGKCKLYNFYTNESMTNLFLQASKLFWTYIWLLKDYLAKSVNLIKLLNT